MTAAGIVIGTKMSRFDVVSITIVLLAIPYAIFMVRDIQRTRNAPTWTYPWKNNYERGPMIY
jgi:hypothetical protein